MTLYQINEQLRAIADGAEFDEETGEIFDEQAIMDLQIARDDKLVENDVNKTYASQRDVPILINRVNVLVKQCPTERIYTGSEHSLYRRINKICRDNDLPEIGLHGLRHSFASLCYHLKLSEEETMRLGGWSTPAVMRKIYTHLAEKDKNEAVDKLKSFFS